ncbi:MAG: hypothetical protein Q8Q00_09535 [Dehalococcoidia bacterium]|nr:hypothetical protein [Dehalococcoidia bacterium]
MNETNRAAIILFAAFWIVLMAVVIFLTWTAGADSVDRFGDLAEYLAKHEGENASRLIVTLGALVLMVLALLLIVVELAPEEETREIRVEQAGATTIVPAEPLRLRLEEALTAMPNVSAARAHVYSRDNGIGMKLDLTVTPDTNLTAITQEASRIVVETLQSDLGLPVAAPPTVRILFGPPGPEPVASSVTQPPEPQPEPPPPSVEPPSLPTTAEAPSPEQTWPPTPPPQGEPAFPTTPEAPSPEQTWPPTPPPQDEPEAHGTGESTTQDETPQP